MDNTITVAIITNVTVIVGLIVAKYDRKKISEKVDIVHGKMETVQDSIKTVEKQTNGMTKTIVSQATDLGIQEGRRKLQEEMERRSPYLYILDDNREELAFLVERVRGMGITKYKSFNDEILFVNELTGDVNVFLIDHMLSGPLNGLDMVARIKYKNDNSFIILCTGYTDERILIKYVNEGIDKIVYKGKDMLYLDECEKFIKEGLRAVLRRR